MPTKLTDVSHISRERIRSTFMEDFKVFMEETVSLYKSFGSIPPQEKKAPPCYHPFPTSVI